MKKQKNRRFSPLILSKLHPINIFLIKFAQTSNCYIYTAPLHPFFIPIIITN